MTPDINVPFTEGDVVCQDAVAGPEGDYCLSYDAAKFPVVSFK
jgi:hypothetical protein